MALCLKTGLKLASHEDELQVVFFRTVMASRLAWLIYLKMNLSESAVALSI